MKCTYFHNCIVLCKNTEYSNTLVFEVRKQYLCYNLDKMKEKKTKKERSDKYEEKLSVKATFDELLDLTIPEPKRQEKQE